MASAHRDLTKPTMRMMRSCTMNPAFALTMLTSLFATTSAFLPAFGGVHHAHAVQATRLFSSVDADVSVLSLSLAKPLGMMLEGT
jgi:hypothetical protein